MVSTVYTVAVWGVEGFEVSVECNVEKGLPEISVIGLPDTSVKEATDRIRAVATNNQLPFVRNRTTINLAPADKKKIGSYYDLAMLVSLLKHNVLENVFTDDAVFIGELSLSGELRPVSGALTMCLTARDSGKKRVFLPAENALEASAVNDMEIYGVRHINDLIMHLRGSLELIPTLYDKEKFDALRRIPVDFAEIKGQDRAKRVLEIAAIGGHNVLMVGPPGSGKSMLAKAFVGILPDMTYTEMLEATKIHSVAGFTNSKNPIINVRPFRSPHHTVSHAGIIGGGSSPNPGEITLAHNGILFLDEMTEFNKKTLESLRQPMEDGSVTVARASYKLTFPTKFILVAATNPCPCGYFGSNQKECTCSVAAVRKYIEKLSGPILDRIDIHIEVPAVKYDDIRSEAPCESSESVRKRVHRAREFAAERIKRLGLENSPKLIYRPENCNLTDAAEALLANSYNENHFSARTFDKTIAIARDVADLELSDCVTEEHMLEAVQMKSIDEKYFEI